MTPPAVAGSLEAWGVVAADAAWSRDPGMRNALYEQTRRWYQLLVLGQDPTTLIRPYARLRSPTNLVRAARIFWPQIALALVLAFVLSACSGTPNVTAPAETDDVPGVTQGATAVPVKTEPAATAGNPGENDIGNGRPTTVTLTVGGTTTGADGSYSATGTTRICGNAQLNLTGNTRGFNYAFPFEGEHQIGDVTFNAEDLLPGSATTSFYISVNVTAADGHEPPSVVIQPNDPDSGDSGNAQRSDSGGTTTLTLKATNDFGETISLTATCGPRPG